MGTELRTKFPIAAAVITVLLFLVIGAVWQWRRKSAVHVPPPGLEKPREEEGTTGFGASLYERARNPVEGELPVTNPFTKENNPLKGIYKNPFE
jgi:hypothetical protein